MRRPQPGVRCTVAWLSCASAAFRRGCVVLIGDEGTTRARTVPAIEEAKGLNKATISCPSDRTEEVGHEQGNRCDSDNEWRWRESNPRPSASHRAFSERSRQLDLGALAAAGEFEGPQPTFGVPGGQSVEPLG